MCPLFMVLRILEAEVLHEAEAPYISLALIKSNLKYKEHSLEYFLLKYRLTIVLCS